MIELLIVIVVLGVLAAIVVFSLSSVAGTSDQAACKSNGATLNTAIAAYNAQNPNGPTVTQAALTGTFVQTWPNNTHYSFGVDGSGNLTITVGGATTAWAGNSSCGAVT